MAAQITRYLTEKDGKFTIAGLEPGTYEIEAWHEKLKIKTAKVTIEDGQTALARLAEVTPAVVVLDLNLPHVSGDEILHQIRADERLAETRVMLATANAMLAETLRGESDLVLLKPISPDQLRDLASRLRPPDTVMD